jgi:hypothetical protein
MTTDLRQALERLDGSIDQLEQAASIAVRKTPRGSMQNGARNRNEVLSRIDSLILRLESFLAH